MKTQSYKISNIFDGEEPKEARESQRKHIKPKDNNIMFNDNYVEKNPNIQQWRKKKYDFEEKYKKEATYFDDMKKPKNTIAFKRKIKDSYENNPLKIYTKEETKKFNEKERERIAENGKREKRIIMFFGSNNLKRTLGGINKSSNIKNEAFNSDKINNNNFNITKNAMILNRDENKQVPYYGKRHFTFMNTSDGKGMSYF